MLNRIAVIALVLALFAFAPAVAGAAPNMQDGEWEITTKMDMKGMPAFMSRPMTYKQCITQKDAVPQKREPNKDCKMVSQKIVGNTVSWVMVCKDKDGTMESSGKITYRKDRFDGTMKATMSGKESGNMDMNYKMTGKRIGPCQGKQ